MWSERRLAPARAEGEVGQVEAATLRDLTCRQLGGQGVGGADVADGHHDDRTMAVGYGEGVRDGRWRGRGKTECGIHTMSLKD